MDLCPMVTFLGMPEMAIGGGNGKKIVVGRLSYCVLVGCT